MHLCINDIEHSLRSNQITASSLIDYCKEVNLPFRWHPLGFIVCNILKEGKRNVRLHIWPIAGGRRQESDCQIHNHIFDFSSWVLLGSVENIDYKESDNGHLFALYSTEYLGEKSILNKSSETIALTVERITQYHSGAVYAISSDQIHETRRVSDGPAVTVLISNDVAAHSPTVIGPLNGIAQQVYIRSVLTNSELDSALTGIQLANERPNCSELRGMRSRF